MVSITLSVSEKTKKLMNQFPEINWSGFIRQRIQEKVEELQWEQQMLNKLKKEQEIQILNSKEIILLCRKVKN